MHNENNKMTKTPKHYEPTVSLIAAIVMSLISYVAGFIHMLSQAGDNPNLGLDIETKLSVLPNHPETAILIMTQAAVFCFMLPIFHVLIASIFRSKRNKNVRRKIFIGWAILILCLLALNMALVNLPL
jgi:amino acid transporter